MGARGIVGLVGLTLCLISWGCGADEGSSARRGGDGAGAGSGIDNGAGGAFDNGGSDDSGFGNGSGASGGTGSDTMQVINPQVGEVTVAGSFIWIANSAEGSVSKIDTETLTELGRYLTSPNGSGSPSRTSVGEDGNAAVANRGYTAQAGQGDSGVTKIFASLEDCVDRNGNGAIETSTGATNVLPWMQDECIAWHTDLPHTSTRPVQWAPSPSPDTPPILWAAGSSACRCNSCSFDVYKLDGGTGAIQHTIPVSMPGGIDYLMGAGLIPGGCGLIESPIAHYGPYGAAADSGGNVWILNANTTHLVRVDAVSHEVQMWPTPMGNGYGITVGSKGRVFICGKLGISRFDPPTAAWQTSSPMELGFNGCMTDGAGTLWVGGGADQGAMGLHGFNTDSLAVINTVAVGGVKGVSIDMNGFVWGVGSVGADGMGDGNTAWRLDPVTGDVQSYGGLNGAYTYSDMTGFGLKQAGFLPPKPPD